MKKTFFFYSMIVIFCMQSFVLVIFNKEIKDYELKQNEVINFKNGPEIPKRYSGRIRRGTYDMTKYTIEIDTLGRLDVSELRGCSGKNQSEIALIHNEGTITRKMDTLKIRLSTNYNKLYLIGIEKHGIIDSFSSNVQIDLVSKTLKNDYCPNLVSTYSHTRIFALPRKINSKEMYKAVHKDNTIGVFTYFALKDVEGRFKTYPEGDYILIGGNSLAVKK